MNTALIVAAGTGSRSKLQQSKVLYEINHKPVFMYSVETFLSLGYEIVLVCAKTDLSQIESFLPPQVRLVTGGKTRSESVKNGLKEVQTPYVFIHDAARPLIQKDKIMEMEKALAVHDAVLLAEPVKQALKRYENGKVSSEVRDHFVESQTPQAFLTEKIRYAHLRNENAYDDDIALYQAFYAEDPVHVIFNEMPNPKITYPEDFTVVEALLNPSSMMRIGHSFDVHRLTSGRPLILGGIEIPFDKGLLGHSDADVLLHAIGEAMLGALALGDLGTFYPDTDLKYKDINSAILITDIHQMIKNKGYQIVNIDSTVFAEKPKLNPYIEKLRQSIASILKISLGQVSVKATTYEGLEAIGKGEAMAAEAIVLLRRKNT